jgi:hypothetical protein
MRESSDFSESNYKQSSDVRVKFDKNLIASEFTESNYKQSSDVRVKFDKSLIESDFESSKFTHVSSSNFDKEKHRPKSKAIPVISDSMHSNDYSQRKSSNFEVQKNKDQKDPTHYVEGLSSINFDVEQSIIRSDPSVLDPDKEEFVVTTNAWKDKSIGLKPVAEGRDDTISKLTSGTTRTREMGKPYHIDYE